MVAPLKASIYNPVRKIYPEVSVRKLLLILSIILTANILLTACSSNADVAAQAVETYWNTIVAKDAERLPTLVCGNYEEDALTVLDSLQAVTARLEEMACTQSGTDGETALVNCTGKMVLT